MIRRKRLTVTQQELLAYKQAAPVSIGEISVVARTQQRRLEKAIIAEVRASIWRTRHRCQLCHGFRRAVCLNRPDQMHEDPSRARTRGLPATERFNLRVCGRLCAACHQDITENRIRCRFEDPNLGFLGRVWPEPVHPKGVRSCLSLTKRAVSSSIR